MQAVLSYEPLTKRRPSGSSARQYTFLVWCVKVRSTAPVSYTHLTLPTMFEV